MNGSVAISLPNEISGPIRSVRSTQDHSFVPLFSRTDAYKYTFFPRTIRDWNSLPNAV